jgi:hypothetical protein
MMECFCLSFPTILIKSNNIEDIWVLIEEINDDRLADDGIPVAAQRDVVYNSNSAVWCIWCIWRDNCDTLWKSQEW